MDQGDPSGSGQSSSGTAVFVDGSGRRATFIRRAAAILVVICLAYGGALLIAALTGVPIRGAFLPYPALDATTHAVHPNKTPHRTPGAGPTSGSGAAVAPSNGTTSSTSRPAAVATPSSAATRPGLPSASATPTAGAINPTATATKSRGQSTSAPGASNRPTSHPSKTATTHGRSGKA